MLLCVVACEDALDERSFRKKAEETYAEAHAGWTIYRKDKNTTTFSRGDQIDVLNVTNLYAEYRSSGKGGSTFLEAWGQQQAAESAARRRTLEQAKDSLVPILKSGTWIRVQDLGAIGPARIREKIRPWRKEVAPELYVILGVPEEKLGYRFASMEEVTTSPQNAEVWLEQAIKNLVARLGEPQGSEVKSEAGRLLALDLDNIDGISAAILDRGYRKKLLDKFELSEVGAAVPIRNVLILFDPTDFVAVKPVRARTHQLYDTQNHPGFRGLLKFDLERIGVMEAGHPKPAQ